MGKIGVFSNKVSLFGIVVLLLGLLFLAPQALAQPSPPGPPGGKPDKKPPVITGLTITDITHNSVVISWTTDEPADSDIEYGIAPNLDMSGPYDATLVLNHTIVLSDLVPESRYRFCVMSNDEAGNDALRCNIFVTEVAPPPVTGGGGGGPNVARISGFAYPEANISFSFRRIPFGSIQDEQSVTASADGSFSVSFREFPSWLYVFELSASDKNEMVSAVKRFQFDFSPSDTPLSRNKIIIPPTIETAQHTVQWGDNIKVFGSAIPNTGVLVSIGDVSYETKSDANGHYGVIINSARLSSGKQTVRARSLIASEFGIDYSLSKSFTIVQSTVPEADLNEDGIVNFTDFSIFLSEPVDINNDGVINSTDISIFIRAFRY